MWAKFDKTNFPLVYVSFNEKINNEEEFNMFLKEWLQLYKDKKKFMFIFDTRNVGLISVSYCYKLKNFMNQMRQMPVQYLEKSIILTSSKHVRFLLSIIFKITKPLARVYIYNKNEEKTSLELLNMIESKDSEKDFTIIDP